MEKSMKKSVVQTFLKQHYSSVKDHHTSLMCSLTVPFRKYKKTISIKKSTEKKEAQGIKLSKRFATYLLYNFIWRKLTCPLIELFTPSFVNISQLKLITDYRVHQGFLEKVFINESGDLFECYNEDKSLFMSNEVKIIEKLAGEDPFYSILVTGHHRLQKGKKDSETPLNDENSKTKELIMTDIKNDSFLYKFEFDNDADPKIETLTYLKKENLLPPSGDCIRHEDVMAMKLNDGNNNKCMKRSLQLESLVSSEKDISSDLNNFSNGKDFKSSIDKINVKNPEPSYLKLSSSKTDQTIQNKDKADINSTVQIEKLGRRKRTIENLKRRFVQKERNRKIVEKPVLKETSISKFKEIVNGKSSYETQEIANKEVALEQESAVKPVRKKDKLLVLHRVTLGTKEGDCSKGTLPVNENNSFVKTLKKVSKLENRNKKMIKNHHMDSLDKDSKCLVDDKQPFNYSNEVKTNLVLFDTTDEEARLVVREQNMNKGLKSDLIDLRTIIMEENSPRIDVNKQESTKKQFESNSKRDKEKRNETKVKSTGDKNSIRMSNNNMMTTNKENQKTPPGKPWKRVKNELDKVEVVLQNRYNIKKKPSDENLKSYSVEENKATFLHSTVIGKELNKHRAYRTISSNKIERKIEEGHTNTQKNCSLKPLITNSSKSSKQNNGESGKTKNFDNNQNRLRFQPYPNSTLYNKEKKYKKADEEKVMPHSIKINDKSEKNEQDFAKHHSNNSLISKKYKNSLTNNEVLNGKAESYSEEVSNNISKHENHNTVVFNDKKIVKAKDNDLVNMKERNLVKTILPFKKYNIRTNKENQNKEPKHSSPESFDDEQSTTPNKLSKFNKLQIKKPTLLNKVDCIETNDGDTDKKIYSGKNNSIDKKITSSLLSENKLSNSLISKEPGYVGNPLPNSKTQFQKNLLEKSSKSLSLSKTSKLLEDTKNLLQEINIAEKEAVINLGDTRNNNKNPSSFVKPNKNISNMSKVAKKESVTTIRNKEQDSKEESSIKAKQLPLFDDEGKNSEVLNSRYTINNEGNSNTNYSKQLTKLNQTTKKDKLENEEGEKLLPFIDSKETLENINPKDKIKNQKIRKSEVLVNQDEKEWNGHITLRAKSQEPLKSENSLTKQVLFKSQEFVNKKDQLMREKKSNKETIQNHLEFEKSFKADSVLETHILVQPALNTASNIKNYEDTQRSTKNVPEGENNAKTRNLAKISPFPKVHTLPAKQPESKTLSNIKEELVNDFDTPLKRFKAKPRK